MANANHASNRADQLAAYLHHQLSLDELVDWAERQVMEADFESTMVRDAVAHIELADIRAFGITWDDCRRLLHDLGFAAHDEKWAAGRWRTNTSTFTTAAVVDARSERNRGGGRQDNHQRESC